MILHEAYVARDGIGSKVFASFAVNTHNRKDRREIRKGHKEIGEENFILELWEALMKGNNSGSTGLSGGLGLGLGAMRTALAYQQQTDALQQFHGRVHAFGQE